VSTFDEATAVEPAGEHLWTSPLNPDWFGSRSPHGGHVAAQLLRAAKLEVGDPAFAPRTLTVHYTSRGKPGTLELETKVERQGRTLQTVTVRGIQDGRVIALGIAALALDRPGPELHDARMPEVPPPERLAGSQSFGTRPETSPLRRAYDLRFAIGVPRSGGPAHAGGWVRLREPRQADDLLVAALADIWVPAVYMSVKDPRPCTTVELTVHFLDRAADLPEDGWFLTVFETPKAHAGYFRENGEVWSQDGRLLACSSQLGVFTD
jgi:acyl-CoA thioesterase